MMAALNFLADGAGRRILFLSFICENVTTIGGASRRRTGRHFTGGAEKICPETNNLP